MNKVILTLIPLLASFLLMAQQDTIVMWTFPGNSGFADGGLSNNLLKEIVTDGGTSAITFKNGASTMAAQATGWHNGTANGKQWLVEFGAAGYSDLHISSKLSSGGNSPGPRDWVMEFKIDCAGIWAPIPGGTLSIANDWTSGAVSNLALPPACADAISLFVRWRMVSDTASDGSIVDSTGICKIDDIVITGTFSVGVQEAPVKNTVSIFPNPASGQARLSVSGEALSCTFVSPDGRVADVRDCGTDGWIGLEGLPRGIYLIRFIDKEGIHRGTQKLVIE